MTYGEEAAPHSFCRGDGRFGGFLVSTPPHTHAAFSAKSVFCLKTACSCKPGSGAVLSNSLFSDSGCNVFPAFFPVAFLFASSVERYYLSYPSRHVFLI